MHVLFKCEVLGSGQRHTRGRNTLNRRVIREVDEQDGTVERAGLTETLDEEVGFLESDAHCGKDNRERLRGSAYLRLPRDLCGEVGVGQTGCREDRQLLAADKGIQPVNC